MSAPVDPDAHMGFVGVSTGSSSIMRVFPQWAEVLDLPTRRLVGHDLPPGSDPGVYAGLIAGIKADPKHRGALVTTHKISVYDGAAGLFDSLDELAVTFGEISSVYKRDGGLHGAARDPVTVRLALEDFLPADHFASSGAEVLVLGSGGSGSALSHQLGGRTDRPARITVTATSAARLDHVRELHARAGLDAALYRYVEVASAEATDNLVAELPAASLVVNATGMGKDSPGSPLRDSALFPEQAYVWDFNYRGSLEFLAQAESQRESRGLVVEDGWRYFVHGWTRVVADVFDLEMPPERVQLLADVAARTR